MLIITLPQYRNLYITWKLLIFLSLISHWHWLQGGSLLRTVRRFTCVAPWRLNRRPPGPKCPRARMFIRGRRIVCRRAGRPCTAFSYLLAYYLLFYFYNQFYLISSRNSSSSPHFLSEFPSTQSTPVIFCVIMPLRLLFHHLFLKVNSHKFQSQFLSEIFQNHLPIYLNFIQSPKSSLLTHQLYFILLIINKSRWSKNKILRIYNLLICLPTKSPLNKPSKKFNSPPSGPLFNIKKLHPFVIGSRNSGSIVPRSYPRVSVPFNAKISSEPLILFPTVTPSSIQSITATKRNLGLMTKTSYLKLLPFNWPFQRTKLPENNWLSGSLMQVAVQGFRSAELTNRSRENLKKIGNIPTEKIK